MRGGVIPVRGGSAPGSRGRVVSPSGREFGGSPICILAGSTTSGTWASANKPCAIPVTFDTDVTVYKLGWFNGSAAGDNVDVGIYDLLWNRKISTGSTGGVGNSVLQSVDVTDTLLPAGRYYVVISRDTTTANRHLLMNHAASAPMMALAGVKDSATNAFPLPDPLTNMVDAATFTRVPLFVVWLR